MRYFKSGLLTLLVSLFILTGCQNPDSIGLDIAPEDQITGTLVESTVEATTVKEDVVITNKLPQQPLGSMQDPIFGTMEATVALSLGLPSDSSQVTFGTSPLLDSAVLVLRYGNEFYGDAEHSAYTVDVHQLNEDYSNTATYDQNKAWNYNTAVIGTKTVTKFQITDSVRINDVLKGKPDAEKKVAPQLRIPLSSSFINDAFLTDGGFASNVIFTKMIKGLYLKINKTGSGGVVFFMPDSSKLELYYKRTNGSAIDTNVVRFQIMSSAANIKHDYTGTPVETQLNDPTQKFESVFVQPLGGVRTRVRFPDIQNLKSLGNIVVNKAELVVYTDQSAITPFTPAPRLTLYRTDIAGQRQEIPDNDIGQLNGYGDSHALDVASFGGFYDKVQKRYVFNVSSYIQNILSGKMQQYDTYLAPINQNLQRSAATSGSANPRITDLFPSATTAAHSVLGSGISTAYKMKLNIYYTRLGK